MATQSPFSWFADTLGQWSHSLPPALVQALTPPAWAVHELQQRVVLFLNHVLMQEPQARDRLQRQKGRQVQLHWRDQVFRCRFTPAGLVELADDDGRAPDLVLRLGEDSPFVLARTVMQGEKPPIRIEGDVQLAAEVNWLIDHVRWEPEEDLARLIGDAPAHALAQAAQRAVQVLRDFARPRAAQRADA